jgi:hypothetical protein
MPGVYYLFMKFKKYLLASLTGVAVTFSHGQSALVAFDLSSVTNGATQYQFINSASGLTLDMSTQDRWQDSGNPQAAVGFISNANSQQGFVGLGVLEETDGFTMTFRFNKRVRLESYTISSVQTPFDDDEFVRLSNGTSTTTESTKAVGDYNFTNRFEVAANTDLTLTSINPTYPSATDVDQHIIWRYFRVTVIPEPETYALLLGGATLGLALLRRRP